MNERTLTFFPVGAIDRGNGSYIKVILPNSKKEVGTESSEGTVASEENLHVAPNDFLNLKKGNFEVLHSAMRDSRDNKDQTPLGSFQSYMQKRASLTPVDLTDYAPRSILQPDYMENASNPSNLSLLQISSSPKALVSANRNGGSPKNRNQSRFQAINEEKDEILPPSAANKKKLNSPHISRSQEFNNVVSPDMEIKTPVEPATATLPPKKVRPSAVANLRRLDTLRRTSKESTKSLNAGQINLIDDKVSLYSDGKFKGFLSPGTDKLKTRKSKLLDKISLIAAKGQELPTDEYSESPAIIFKQVLKKVNPAILQKAEKKLKRRYFISIKKAISKLAKYPFQVFSPEDKFSLFWNILTPIMICIDTFLTPFLISFYGEGGYEDFLTMATVITMFFILDIFINFRTAFYDKGVLITNSSAITKNYLTQGFTADFSVVLADILALIYSDTSIWYVKFMSFIRIKKLWDIITRSEDFLIMSRTWHAILKLLKLWGLIVIVAHWFACLFHMIAHRRLTEEETWLERNHIADASVLDRYIPAFYWSITTMVTVGYGDITPISNVERLYVVVAMMISSILFGYSLNTVGEIIREMSYEKDQRREKIRSVRKYMNQKNLGKNIQIRVKNYIQYMIDSRMLYKHDDEEFFDLLSQNLKDEIISEVNGKILGESKLFSTNFTVKAAARLATQMKEQFVSPEELIFEEGDLTDCSIYFIVYGKIQIDYRVKKIKVLEKGAHFGELSFFSGRPRNARAKSLFFTNLYSLKREVTVEKLKAIPSDFEMFHFIKDNVNLYENYTQLELQCYSCEQVGHAARNCPEIHFTPDREEVVREYLVKEANFMKKYKRRKCIRFSARGNLDVMESAARMVQEDYNDYTISDEELSQDSIDIILERNLILVPGGELNDMKNRKLDRKRKSTRLSANMFYEQVASVNEIIQKKEKGSVLSTNMIREEVVYDPMAIKSMTGEFIFFSIDKVENFELYFPQNNVIRMITEFEKQRFEQLLESRQGIAKALVIRNFGGMLRSNKGPHKSPLFYANLKKERLIQRGRKKANSPELKALPPQRLRTLMEFAKSNKKSGKLRMPTNKFILAHALENMSDTPTSSQSSTETRNKGLNGKKGTLEDDEATLAKSERLRERRQTNPSLFMNKLTSLNPKMMHKDFFDAKLSSRASSLEQGDGRKETFNMESDRRQKTATDVRNTLLTFVNDEKGGAGSSKELKNKSRKGRKSSRCSSQGKIEEVKRLVDKIDVGTNLFHQFVGDKLNKTSTANFGN